MAECLVPSGVQVARLSVQATAGDGQAFGDVVSGPHALTFSDDGKLAFVRTYDVDTGGAMQFWSGMVALS